MTGRFGQLIAQLAQIQQLAAAIFGTETASAQRARRDSRRFRLFLGGVLGLLAIGSVAFGYLTLKLIFDSAFLQIPYS